MGAVPATGTLISRHPKGSHETRVASHGSHGGREFLCPRPIPCRGSSARDVVEGARPKAALVCDFPRLHDGWRGCATERGERAISRWQFRDRAAAVGVPVRTRTGPGYLGAASGFACSRTGVVGRRPALWERRCPHSRPSSGEERRQALLLGHLSQLYQALDVVLSEDLWCLVLFQEIDDVIRQLKEA